MFGVLLRLYIKHVCCHHAISTTLLLDGKITRIPWGVTISSWIPRLIICSVKHWCWWCRYPTLPWRYFLGLRSMWYHHWIHKLINILTDNLYTIYGCMKITNIKIQMFSNTSQFRFFDNKFASRDLIIWELITHTGPAGLVWQIWVSGPVWSGNSHAQSGQATACFVKKILPGFGAEWHAPYTWLLTRIVAKKETNLSQQKSS